MSKTSGKITDTNKLTSSTDLQEGRTSFYRILNSITWPNWLINDPNVIPLKEPARFFLQTAPHESDAHSGISSTDLKFRITLSV